MKLTKFESKNYLLKEPKDYEILTKAKELEKTKIANADKRIVKLIKTRLKKDWRTDLIKELNRLIKKNKK
jgi:hypothetical protein